MDQTYFKDHITRDHNMWQYAFLFVHLFAPPVHQSPLKKRNVELLVRDKVLKWQMDFFPQGQAMELEDPTNLDNVRAEALNILIDRDWGELVD
jgi:hypothetical protein